MFGASRPFDFFFQALAKVSLHDMPVSRIYTSRQFGTTYIQTCGIILKAHSTILSIFHLYMTSSSKQMDRNRNVAARNLNSDTYIEIEEAGSQ
jgi:hypothetical protein